MGIGPGDHGAAGLDRLAQGIQDAALEFRQFIEEQHAAMGEADLAGLCPHAAADQCGLAGRMMRVAEGPAPGDRAPGQLPGNRLHEGQFQRFRRLQRRQQAGQARGQHALARAGRPDHQQVMAPGGGDFQRPLGAFLALHVAQVQAFGAVLRRAGAGRGQHLGALEMIHQGDQGGRRQHGDIAGPGRLRPGNLRTDQALLFRRGGNRGIEHAGHRVQPPVQR